MTWGIYNEDLPEFSFDKVENISRYLEIFTKLYNDDIAYDWHTRQGFAGETDIFTTVRRCSVSAACITLLSCAI